MNRLRSPCWNFKQAELPRASGGICLTQNIIGTLNNGMILMQIPTFYQLLAKGALFIGAVMALELRRERQTGY